MFTGWNTKIKSTANNKFHQYDYPILYQILSIYKINNDIIIIIIVIIIITIVGWIISIESSK